MIQQLHANCTDTTQTLLVSKIRTDIRFWPWVGSAGAKTQTGPRLTESSNAGRDPDAWVGTTWEWASSVPWLQGWTAASWAVLTGSQPGHKREGFSPSTWHLYDFIFNHQLCLILGLWSRTDINKLKRVHCLGNWNIVLQEGLRDQGFFSPNRGFRGT